MNFAKILSAAKDLGKVVSQETGADKALDTVREKIKEVQKTSCNLDKQKEILDSDIRIVRLKDLIVSYEKQIRDCALTGVIGTDKLLEGAMKIIDDQTEIIRRQKEVIISYEEMIDKYKKLKK